MITEQLTDTPAHGLPSGILVNSRTGQLTEIVASYYMPKMSLASSASRTYKATEQRTLQQENTHHGTFSYLQAACNCCCIWEL